MHWPEWWRFWFAMLCHGIGSDKPIRYYTVFSEVIVIEVAKEICIHGVTYPFVGNHKHYSTNVRIRPKYMLFIRLPSKMIVVIPCFTHQLLAKGLGDFPTGYTGSTPILTKVPFFALFGIAGAVCGSIWSSVGLYLKAQVCCALTLARSTVTVKSARLHSVTCLMPDG